MATNNSAKLEEALDHVHQAEKCMKTSFLKWKADYDIAADHYQRAATCYKVLKSYQQSKECLMKAAECFRNNRALFHVAKCYEQTVFICKDMGDLQGVAHYAEAACQNFQEHGSPDSGAICLEKAAKMIEAQYPERALDLYRRAADVVSIEDQPRQAAEFVSKLARILVKLQMYDQAADTIRREISLHQVTENIGMIGRLAIALVLVQLARGDYVAAEKAFKELGNYCEGEEVGTLEMLLQGFDEEDPEMASRALRNPFIMSMDVEYARLARDLPLPKGIAQPTHKPSVRENAAPSYISPNASKIGGSADELTDKFQATGLEEGEEKTKPSNEEEDDYSGGLC